MAAKAKKPFQPQVLTANSLTNGEVVYWQKGGAWVDGLEDALVFETLDATTSALESAEADVEARKILDPYLFTVSVEGGAIHPASVREQIRAKGPTVRLDLGKQAA